MKTKINLSWIVIFVLLLASPCVAAPTPEQEAGGQERTRELQEKEKALREKIEQAPQAPQITQETPALAPAQIQSQEKVLVKTINVTGATLIYVKEIDSITAPYKNKEITLNDLQRAADMITDLYRKKGYITSRAYLPPQKIENNTVEIRIIEGVMGDLDVKGNKFFKTGLFIKRIGLKKGDPFNYNILRGNLSKINQYPDRNVKTVLAPGKEPGSTDVMLEVKDRLPIHVSFDWDNFGSRYIDKHRYQAIVTDNNLLGFDDILTLQYQIAQHHDLQEQHDFYRLMSMRYLFPVNDATEIGFYAANSKLTLGREYLSLQARGKSQYYSLYGTHTLINNENLTVNLNGGFDYKNIFNFQLGNETSRDILRIVKAGIEFDRTDNNGRTIISNELDVGIPNKWGALKEQDSRSSRGSSGSGGAFTKNTLDILRLQKMPWSSTLLIKNQNQLTPSILTASEQFQIGGIANVRGYPPAEFAGDRGYSITGEWSFPPYLVSKDIKVPLSKARLYDALRLTAFYDWANTWLRNPQAGEHRNITLRGTGVGMRFNLPEDFSIRMDMGWPLDRTPSDGHHVRTWIKITKGF
jgi:hemolysin activation/secretion protein